VVASNVTSFNMSGLTASSDSTGTILEFDLGRNIAPSAGTLNTVAKIDTDISTLQGELAVVSSNLSVGGIWKDMSTTNNNTGVGVGALGTNVATSDCTAVSYNAMNSCTTGGNNTGVGSGALQNITTNGNSTAVGYSCLQSCNAGNNTAIGSTCLPNLTTGNNTVALGFWAGRHVTTGHGNTLLGTATALSLVTGNDDTIVGNNTEVFSSDCSESIVLGARCTNTASNQLYISPSITNFNISGLAPSTDSTGAILEFDSGRNIAPSAGTHNSLGH